MNNNHGCTNRQNEPRIFNIQRFSIHDGPGIRTTVFFCGCPLRCKWCHNPEGLIHSAGLYNLEGGRDPESRNSREGERDPGADYRAWPVGELADELAKDRIFYDESGGGATLSGGEPLSCDMAYIAALMTELGRRGVSVAIDTCGDVPYAAFAGVLHLTDLFLYDIKMLDDSKHIFYTGVSNKRILVNLSRLSRDGAAICLRLPLLAGVNDGLDDMERIARWLEAERVKPKLVSLLPYHAYARGKYTRLGLAPPAFDAPHAERLDELRHFWFASGYKVGFGGGGVPDII